MKLYVTDNNRVTVTDDGKVTPIFNHHDARYSKNWELNDCIINNRNVPNHLSVMPVKRH